MSSISMGPAPGPSTPTINLYQPLPFKRKKNERHIFSSERPFVPTFVQMQLRKSRNLDAKALYDSRVKGKQVLLENPVRERKVKARLSKVDEKKRLAIARNTVKPLKGQWKMTPPHRRRYDLYLPLHHLWLGYMSELLALSKPPQTIPNEPTMPSTAAMHAKLVKADFHGAIVTVKRAKNPCLVGLSGIVIQDRENTFVVVTDKNAFKTVPKQGSIFVFRIPLYNARTLLPSPQTLPAAADNAPSKMSSPYTLETVPYMEFELYGNQFCFRSSDRASKKFKSKETIEI